MSFVESFLPEFDREMASTRLVLERVPDGRRDWRPHSKSRTAGELAVHLAHLADWVVLVLERDEVDVTPAGGPPLVLPSPATTRETLDAFDAAVKLAHDAIARCTEDQLAKKWSLKMAGKVLTSMPRTLALRGFILNHVIHHRGAMTVYLRLLDVPLPRIYGPTADEPH